ncbi:class I SAM-dependent methyltransferase, partial [Planctomycetota bacterium]|nr:class I SAM-dependent methyltransferase [Planctomycetota bacterium]
RLEALVLELPDGESDELMMLMKESRGAWAMLLDGAAGRALFVGNSFSGTPVALGTLGFEVTVLEREPARLRFALERAAALAPGSSNAVAGGDCATLPFMDRSFDLVVLEGGLPSPATGWGFSAEELRRVCRRELIITADNRLGYKRSTGRRGAPAAPPRSTCSGRSSSLHAESERSRARAPLGAAPGRRRRCTRSTPTPGSSATWSPSTTHDRGSPSGRGSARTA